MKLPPITYTAFARFDDGDVALLSTGLSRQDVYDEAESLRAHGLVVEVRIEATQRDPRTGAAIFPPVDMTRDFIADRFPGEIEDGLHGEMDGFPSVYDRQRAEIEARV